MSKDTPGLACVKHLAIAQNQRVTEQRQDLLDVVQVAVLVLVRRLDAMMERCGELFYPSFFFHF